MAATVVAAHSGRGSAPAVLNDAGIPERVSAALVAAGGTAKGDEGREMLAQPDPDALDALLSPCPANPSSAHAAPSGGSKSLTSRPTQQVAGGDPITALKGRAGLLEAVPDSEDCLPLPSVSQEPLVGVCNTAGAPHAVAAALPAETPSAVPASECDVDAPCKQQLLTEAMDGTGCGPKVLQAVQQNAGCGPAAERAAAVAAADGANPATNAACGKLLHGTVLAGVVRRSADDGDEPRISGGVHLRLKG